MSNHSWSNPKSESLYKGIQQMSLVMPYIYCIAYDDLKRIALVVHENLALAWCTYCKSLGMDITVHPQGEDRSRIQIYNLSFTSDEEDLFDSL